MIAAVKLILSLFVPTLEGFFKMISGQFMILEEYRCFYSRICILMLSFYLRMNISKLDKEKVFLMREKERKYKHTDKDIYCI